MKAVNVGFVALLLTAVMAIYVVFVSFSENRAYKQPGIDFWILTPTLIVDLVERCKSEPHFIYSAADGPKPTVTTLQCTLVTDDLGHLVQQGFSRISEYQFKKDTSEIEITWNDKGEVTSISLLEFL